MRHIIVTGVLLCVLCTYAWADGFSTAIKWQGWTVETTECQHGEKYPLVNMFDGTPETAWVFNQKLFADMDEENFKYKHGEGEYVNLQHTGDPISITGISLINGYAKSEQIYQRNNRIYKLKVTVRSDGKDWEKTVDLIESRSAQKISFPRVVVKSIRLEVVQVALGNDDDLCISELSLLDGEYKIPWGIASTVIANDSSGGECGCGGGPYYSFLTPGGNKATIGSAPSLFEGIAVLPDSQDALIWNKGTVYLCNLLTQRELYTHDFGKMQIIRWGWIDTQTAYIGVASSQNEYKNATWYKFSRKDGFSMKKMDAPKDTQKYLNEEMGPNYGA